MLFCPDVAQLNKEPPTNIEHFLVPVAIVLALGGFMPWALNNGWSGAT